MLPRLVHRHYFRSLTLLVIAGLFLSTQVLLASDYSEVGLPITRVYTTNDYQEHVQNWAILQADNGLIYVGNGNGLLEWDGENWRSYPTIRDTRLRMITQWHDGRIYFGTDNDLGYYDVDQTGQMSHFSLLNEWPDKDRQFGEIWSLAANSSMIAFVASNHLFVFDGSTVHRVENFEPGAARVFSINDELLIKSTDSSVLQRIQLNQKPQLVPVFNGIPEATRIRAMFADEQNGLIIVTTAQGVLYLKDDNLSTMIPPEAFGDNVRLYSGLIASDGYLYLGSLQHGLFIASPDGRLIRNYQQQHGIGTNTVLWLTEDYQKNIWFSGVNAIARLIPPHRYSRHSTSDNARELEAIVKLDDRKVLLGFNFYLMKQDPNSLFPPMFVAIDGAPTQYWNAAQVGEQIIVSSSGGVFALTFDENDQLINREQLVTSLFAYDLHVVPGTSTVFATSQDGVHKLTHKFGQWDVIRVQGIDHPVHYISAENRDLIWAGTSDQRLYRISQIDESGNADISRFGADDGLGPNHIYPIMLNQDMYFGTKNGLVRYHPDQPIKFQHDPDLPEVFRTENLDVHRMMQDSLGRIWYRVGGHTGVAEKSGDQWQVDHMLFKPFPVQTPMSFMEDSENVVWFVQSSGGLFRLNLQQMKQVPPAAPLYIRKVTDLETNELRYGGHSQPVLQPLDQDTNSIRIEYAQADYVVADRTQYRTRLLGSGKSRWSDWSREHRKDYTLLSGGNYQFQVQAQDAYGRMTEETSMSFYVQPPWYLTPAAIAAYIWSGMIVLALALLAGSRWRRRQHLEQQQALEQLVQTRTQELANANRKLQQLADSDGLTNIANRRLFDRSLKEVLSKRQPIALVLLDVDHFKQYNDARGHLAGDDVLKKLAEILNRNRSDDVLTARFGGEEFAVIMEGASLQQATDFAEKLRARVASELNGITISAGVAVAHQSTDTSTSESLIQAADAALYQAKSSGRNRVEVQH